MAKTSQIARNQKRIKMTARMSAKRAALKKEGNWEELQKLPKNSSAVRIKNRCSVTGRSRGYMRYFGISRQQFREMARRGEIPGVTKSSW
jgi:small subunit ribosomal protein S14